MCMSVKKIEERICVPKNEVLEQKLCEITRREKIDNYSLNMISDNYGFSLIYAISDMVLGVVKLQEKLAKIQNCHSELVSESNHKQQMARC